MTLYQRKGWCTLPSHIESTRL